MKAPSRLPTASLALVLAFNLQPLALLAQGSLTPPGAPAPTMKTLAQVEPRTPISSAPYTISAPGSYYLTTNLTVTTGTAITIASDGVTLDLNGFTLSSTAPSPTGYGVQLSGTRSDLAILNGHIKGGVTNNGSGVYSGTGFAYGIYGSAPFNTRVAGVSVAGCLNHGIHLGLGSSTVVESCTVKAVGSSGIVATTVKQSSGLDCGYNGISGVEVSDCRGETSGSGYGVYAYTALNCYGNSTSGYGVYANTAQNCYGLSASGYGVYATTAQNCYGYSTSGDGVYAVIAQNCYGYSTSSYGVYAYSALNCYGSCGGSSTGVNAGCTAIGCYGYAYSGTGLRAWIANSCLGSTYNGVAQSITYKYNMP